MNRTKISELAKQVRGVSYKPEDLHNGLDQNSVVLLRANNIDDGKINFDEVVYVDKSKVSKEQYLQKGDILICASSGSKQLVGKAATVSFEKECTFGAFCKVVRPLPAFADYLGAFFQSDIYRKTISEVAIGANINNIRNEHIDFLEIPVGTADENNEKVEKIRLLQSIIEKRKHELQSLDDLIKARFVEMFGDPIVNPKGYPIVPISDLFDVGSSKRVFEYEWRSEGVPFYRAREIVKLSKDGFVDNDLFIEEGLYEKYKAKYGVPKAGDMMVTGVGTLGICYIVQPNDRFYFKDGNTLWFKNKGLCNVRFIMEQYNTDFVRGQIEANANVSTVGTYTITNANNTMILLPSIEEQNEFDSFVSQVDKSKFAVQKALDKAHLLFDSLMQKYFG